MNYEYPTSGSRDIADFVNQSLITVEYPSMLGIAINDGIQGV